MEMILGVLCLLSCFAITECFGLCLCLIHTSNEMLLYLCVVFYTPKTPATTGVFIYLNIPRSLKNSIQYLAPSPTSTAYLEPLSPPK
jgi:hypothetical protein